MYISVGAYMSFSCKKGEFDRCFNRLDRLVKESQPDRPVDSTSACRPDRFPSLVQAFGCGPTAKYPRTSPLLHSQKGRAAPTNQGYSYLECEVGSALLVSALSFIKPGLYLFSFTEIVIVNLVIHRIKLRLKNTS